MISELRVVPIEFRVQRDEGKPARLIGHAAVFNRLSEDLGGFREQIAPGAFREAITTDDVLALINHDPNFVLGRRSNETLTLAEDELGLAVDITPPDTQAARDLMVLIERRDITQMSFGFSVARPGGDTWTDGEGGMPTRTVLKVKRLWDVSPVAMPAYPQTDVAVRSLQAWRQSQPNPAAAIAADLDLRARRLRLIEIG